MDSLGCALAVSLAMALTGGSPSEVERPVETVMQDDAQMLHGSEHEVRHAAREMRGLGVDRVRITASWFFVAPGIASKRRPSFDASDPNAYPRGNWGHLDRAVKAVRAAGLKPMLDVAFFAPRWAVARGAPNGDNRWRPSAREFGRFSEAVARRYNGGFDDPAEKDAKLPAVRLWTTWNEPNHRSFLLPQWEPAPQGGPGRAWRPESPHIYRRMHEAGYAAIKGVNEDNKVLLGGTSFLGGEQQGPYENVPPLRFARELACVDSRYRPLRRAECRGFRPLRADGFAHHPYSLYHPPGVPDPAPDNVRIADLPRLASTLEELHRRGRIARPLPVYVTEYGYETNPPDTTRGVSLDQQAEYLGEAAYLAWRRPEVRMFAQFLLRDIGPNRSAPEGSAERWSDYQTGLLTHEGRAKPALNAFRLPFWVERAVTEDGREGLLAFGQVRPGTGPHQLSIELLADGAWTQVASVPVEEPAAGEDCATFASDPAGFFIRFLPLDRGNQTLRAVWHRLDVPPVISQPITVSVDRAPSPIRSLLRPSG